jgi:lipopolysaccharide biosynthesis glycosyltransferase
MNIIYSCDNKIAKYATTSMASVCVNHRDEQVNFYFLSKGFDEYTIGEIKKTAAMYGANVEFIKVPDGMFADFRIGKQEYQNYWPEETYYYFMAHELLPHSIARALYMDVDVIVSADIRSYYYDSFDGKLMLVTRSEKDIDVEQMMKKPDRLFLSSSMNEIFNTGVLVMNLEGFRKNNININTYLEFVNYVEQNGMKEELFADQGIMNGIFADKVKLCGRPLEYNDNFNMYGDSKILHAAGHIVKPWVFRMRPNIDPLVYGNGRKPFEWVEANIRLSLIWWEYAKLASNYEAMLAEVEQFEKLKYNEYNEKYTALAKWYKYKVGC